jgi:hypothetical protein
MDVNASEGDKPQPVPRAVEPLRQYGAGPVLLSVYTISLAVLHFLLVTLGPKPSMLSC